MFPLHRMPQPEMHASNEDAITFPILLCPEYRNLLFYHGFSRIADRGELRDIDEVLETAGFFMERDEEITPESVIDDYLRFCVKIESQWQANR